MLRGVIFSLIGGAIGALIWIAVGYFTHYEVGWIAWGVGALAGGGMARGLDGRGDVVAGGFAALIAVLGVLAGKYGVVHFAIQHEIAEIEASPIEPEALRVRLADRIVGEWEGEGRALVWPAGMTIDEAYRPQDYRASGFRVGSGVHSRSVDARTSHEQEGRRRPWSSVAVSVGRAQPRQGRRWRRWGARAGPWSA